MGKQRSPREPNELRKKAKKLPAETGEKISGIPSEKDIQHPAHELSVYHIELEMQNDELRRAQEQLEGSRSRYFDLYENAPVGYLTLDNKGVVLDMNLTAARLLGIERTFLLNKPFAFLIAPESQDAFYLHIRDLLHSPGTRACELALRRGKGGERFFHVQLESIAVQANGTTAIRTVLTDIAERKRTEKALVRAKEEWERTFDSVPDMIAIIDNQYHILRANKATTQRLGLEPEQCVGLHCYEAMHGLSQPPEFCPHSKTLKDGRQHSEEVHEERLGGDFVISTTPLADEHGQMVGVVHVARDITKRKQAEEALRESEAKYRSLFENSLDAIFVTVPDGSILAANPAACALFGMTEAELIAMRPAGLTDQDDPRLAALAAERARIGHVKGEATFIRKDGTKFPTSVTSVIVEGGTRAFVILTDITQRKQAEEALRESGKRFRSVFENAAVGMALVDPEGHMLQTNSAMQTMLGYSDDEFRTMRFADFTHPGDIDMSLENVSGIYSGERQKNDFEKRYIARDGREVWVHVSLAMVSDEAGRPRYHVGVIEDINMRKRAEMDSERLLAELESRVQERTAELQRAYDRLKEETDERNRVEQQLLQTHKMEAIGTLAGGIAHDFNNMLAVVLGNAELALDDLDDRPGPKQNIKEIIRASKRSTELVRQILTFSRKTEQEKIPFNLIPLVKETHNLLRSSLPATIHMQLNIKTTSDTIIGDPSRVQQVLMNLCTNAAYATRDKGSLLIELSSTAFDHADEMPEADMKAGNYVKLVVRDSGTGITEEVQKRMFEPFFTTKEAGHGTGMGLAVVYGIVKSHGGAISVESRPGEGSTFAILLPCAGSPVKEAREQAGVVPGGNERILFVDDEAAVVEMTCRALRRIGYDVTAASSGSEAFKTFLQEPGRFDLIITDQTMPDLTGIDLAKRMLAIRNDMPIILITGYSEAVSPEKAKEAGIREFLMKPVEKRELAETVRRALVGKVGTR